MKSQYLLDWFSRLDTAFEKAKESSKGDPELEGYLAGYLVVLVSGAFEDCVEHLVGERAAKTKDAEVVNFVRQATHRLFRNPEYRYVKNLVGEFSTKYADELDTKVDSNAREAINSIVTNRHAVSHGHAPTVTLGDVEGYFQRAAPIFNALEEILG